MRKLSVSIAALLVCVFADGSQSLESRIALLNRCPEGIEQVCLPMAMDVLPEHRSAVIVDAVGPCDMTSAAQYSLEMRGRLGDGEIATHVVSYEAFTQGDPPLTYQDGLGCKTLGYGNIVSLGFDDSGNPVLLTDRGKFTVTDSRYQIGCKDCLKAYWPDVERPVTYASPDWDMSGSVYKPLGGFVLNLDRSVYVSYRGRCISYQRNAAFEFVADSKCTEKPAGPTIATPDGESCYGTDSSHESLGSCEMQTPPVLILVRGACT